MSYLCNLEIKPLSVMLFANIFSHSVGYFFILFVVSFAVKKIVTLSPICLFLFLFLLPWETDLRKHWYGLCQRIFCLCSLLGVLWCCMFKSLSYFEFIFVYGGFSRQEYWSGLPFSSSGDLPVPGIEPRCPALIDAPLY